MAITLTVASVFYAGKAADERSAFVRWRHQVLELFQGVNIYDSMLFPNPPIMPITLIPLMALPPVVGALGWFALKAGLTIVAALMCFRMVRPEGVRIPPWVEGAILLLSLRPILSDLHHGNNNLFILFLVVSTLYAWRKGYDVLAGLILGYAITFKVTPALFVPYFLYKRSWRTVGATFLGMGICFIIVPSMVLGPRFNLVCLASWWHRMLSPFIMDNDIGDTDINQSMGGVVMRLLTEAPRQEAEGRYTTTPGLNLFAWDPNFVVTMVKVMSLGLVGMLGLLCRTRTTRRDDPRMLGEFALVVLTMLFVSERSWKHHYVTILLPITYLAYRAGRPDLPRWTRRVLVGALALATGLMATTSSEIGGLFFDGVGHKIAQGYGMFFWAGVVLYLATAWRVVAERREEPAGPAPVSGLPAPHVSAGVRQVAPG